MPWVRCHAVKLVRKNGHILPTGQWYAPSAVQGVLHIALYRALHSAVHSIVQSYTLFSTLFYSVLRSTIGHASWLWPSDANDYDDGCVR